MPTVHATNGNGRKSAECAAGPLARLLTPRTSRHGDERPALAVFCYEEPDSRRRPVRGSNGRRPWPRAAIAGPPVFPPRLRARCPRRHRPRGGRVPRGGPARPGAGVHPPGLQRLPAAVSAAAPSTVTLMGYEWSAVPGAVDPARHQERRLHPVAALAGAAAQRHDQLSSASRSRRSSWPGCARRGRSWSTSRPRAEVAKYWVPECADRIVNARQLFPVAAVREHTRPRRRSRRATRSARWTRRSCSSAT